MTSYDNDVIKLLHCYSYLVIMQVNCNNFVKSLYTTGIMYNKIDLFLEITFSWIMCVHTYYVCVRTYYVCVLLHVKGLH